MAIFMTLIIHDSEVTSIIIGLKGLALNLYPRSSPLSKRDGFSGLALSALLSDHLAVDSVTARISDEL